MTDVYVISGFLGAGKTTLIKTMVHSAFKNKKLVVIENDFGEAGIDAGLLKDQFKRWVYLLQSDRRL